MAEINDRYESDYQHEKRLLMFNLFEKQYILQTKTAYWEAQNDLITNIKTENQNLQSIIGMYTARFEGNDVHIQKLTDGTKIMETYISSLKDDLKKVCDSIEFLDTNRQQTSNFNNNLRTKYISLLKTEISKYDKPSTIITDTNQIQPMIQIILDSKTCTICCNEMSEKKFNCKEGHLLCKHCAGKVNKCPFCGTEQLTRNRFVESIFKATKDIRKADQALISLE